MAMLSEEEKFELLQGVSIFSETEQSVLKELAGVIREKSVKRGFSVIRKGEQGNTMYIVARGRFRVHDGNHVLSRMHEKDVFGEYTLIDEEPRSATVTAEDDSLVLELAREDFYRIATHNSEIIRGILRVLIRRMREMNSLEEKLSKSYLKIRKQKEQIEKQSENIFQQKAMLEQHNYDLSKLNEEKNHLLSMVIHQIKNPLTSSLLMVDLMEMEKSKLSGDQQEGLDILRNSLKRINNMVNEILDVNAIDSKVYQLKVEEIDMTGIVKELLTNYQYVVDSKNITIHAELEEISSKLNRVYFTQIVDNLLSNAVKYTPADKKIYVNLKDSGKKIIFSIRDEGPGIDRKMVDNIFDQYKRQTEMKLQDLPPEGLGLAIVRRYTTLMNGEVNCECSPDQGTTFEVSFKRTN